MNPQSNGAVERWSLMFTSKMSYLNASGRWFVGVDPTGSTAYNKSVGGAVLHPSINAIQLAEIASLNNRVFRTLGSPIVIADSEWLEIKLQDSNDYLITVDSLDIQQDEIDRIYYRIADERIQFASYRHMHFWHRVKDAFIGEDE